MTNRERKTLDSICASRTAFKTFDELIAAVVGSSSYRPSLDVSDPVLAYLADMYDAEIRELKLTGRLAYRYHSSVLNNGNACLILSWTVKGLFHNSDAGIEDLTDHWKVFEPDQDLHARVEYHALVARRDVYAAVLSKALLSTDGYESR